MKHTGVIATFFATRGFGFLADDADGVERFFHISSCGGFKPEVGQRVEFEVGSPAKVGKGPQCLNVFLLPRTVQAVEGGAQ